MIRIATLVLIVGCGRIGFDSGNASGGDARSTDGAGDSDAPGVGYPAGAIAYWPFDEMTGTTTADGTGNANAGTLENAARFNLDRHRGFSSLEITAATDYVEVLGTAVLDNLTAFSLSFWRNSNTVDGWVFCKTNDDSSAGPGISFDAGRAYYYRAFSGGSMEVLAPANVAVGTWEHYVFTTDGSADRTGSHFYKNGVELAQSGGMDATGTIGDDTAEPAILGNWDTLSSAGPGLLDELMLWNRALTPAEVVSLEQF